jgi:hypothetical protein
MTLSKVLPQEGKGKRKPPLTKKLTAEGESKGKTPYQGERCCVGFYQCHLCNNEWSSVYSWANTGQLCKPCSTSCRPIYVFPYRQIPKSRRYDFFCVNCDQYIAESYRDKDAHKGVVCEACGTCVLPDWEFECDDCGIVHLYSLAKSVAMRGTKCTCRKLLFPKHMASLNKKHLMSLCQKCHDLGSNCTHFKARPKEKPAPVKKGKVGLKSRVDKGQSEDSVQAETTKAENRGKDRLRKSSGGRGGSRKISTDISLKEVPEGEAQPPKPRRKQVRKSSNVNKNDSGFVEAGVEEEFVLRKSSGSRGGRGGGGSGRGRVGLGGARGNGRARKPRLSFGEEDCAAPEDNFISDVLHAAPTPKNSTVADPGISVELRKKHIKPRRRRNEKSGSESKVFVTEEEVQILAEQVAHSVIISAKEELNEPNGPTQTGAQEKTALLPNDENNNAKSQLKGGHAPARKVGGRRISQSGRKSESEGENHGSSRKQESKEKGDEGKDEQQLVPKNVTKPSPDVVSPAKIKPLPSKEKGRMATAHPNHPINKHPIQQPRKD